VILNQFIKNVSFSIAFFKNVEKFVFSNRRPLGVFLKIHDFKN
jgi:hypothetical protein